MTVRDGAFPGESGHSSHDVSLRVTWQQIAEFGKGADTDPSKFTMDSRFEGMCLTPPSSQKILRKNYGIGNPTEFSYVHKGRTCSAHWDAP
jgi:hypothetical protein